MIPDRILNRLTVESDGCVTLAHARESSAEYPKVGFVVAHRYFYEQMTGTHLGRSLVLHHVCENKRCVRLDHLQPMTRSAHASIHESLGNSQRAKTHCPQGHPYEGDNVAYSRRSDGGLARNCVVCHRRAVAASDRRSRPWRYKDASVAPKPRKPIPTALRGVSL